MLPLGISFFTFTQIAFLVDCSRSDTKSYGFVTYSLFVTYFPHLLAGPIIHHNEVMPQFDDRDNKRVNRDHLRDGALLFLIGLSKKVILADALTFWANRGFSDTSNMTFFVAWSTSLCYTFQLYFDFSGYTDMALGASMMLNIRLPINFNSPYKALNLQDFWKRWHITLSRFLRDYLYIPLGGNRKGKFRTVLNLFLTFTLGGIWHGAGWTFLLWGMLHGLGVVVFRLWQKTRIKMPVVIAWFLTFNFVNICWIFFRAQTFHDALAILRGMVGLEGLVLPHQLLNLLPTITRRFIGGSGTITNLGDGTVMGFIEMEAFLLLALMLAVFSKNSQEMSPRQREIACILTLAFCIQKVFFNQIPSEFLYFRF